MPSFIDVGPAVSDPKDFENVDDARTDGRTFDQIASHLGIETTNKINIAQHQKTGTLLT